MSVAVKLGAFLLGLVLVFGLAFAIGHALEPVDRPPVHEHVR